jgi:tetratricopeptide (TPR) repeat protein
VDCYLRAIKLDNYLAVAYFQQGVSNFLMGDFEEALANFNDTLLYLRGNNNIDYEQLGLKFKLFSCEVLFNRGLCYIYLQQIDQGMQDLVYAAKEKVVPDHNVIDEAIREQAQGYTVFSIPVGIVYRPNEAKVKNLKAKDYLGKAKLVAATDRSQAFTGFTGAEIKKMGTTAKDDRPEENLSFAASNLVRTDLRSRARQQSEPPLNRNMFPPTPPPESDKPPSSPGSVRSGKAQLSRAESVKAGPRPQPLDLTVAGFAGSKPSRPPNGGLQRTQSERPGNRRPQEPPATRLQRSNTYADDVYDMYGRQSIASRRGRETYISEEEEDEYSMSYDEGDFEMLGPRPALSARSSGSTRRSGPSVKKIRVKVHADDTRYVLVGSAVEFRDFVDQIRKKFGLRQSFKIKIKDDTDMITMADQDDLDMAIEIAKSAARREKSDMGKMEVSLRHRSLHCYWPHTDITRRSGFRSFRRGTCIFSQSHTLSLSVCLSVCLSSLPLS